MCYQLRMAIREKKVEDKRAPTDVKSKRAREAVRKGEKSPSQLVCLRSQRRESYRVG